MARKRSTVLFEVLRESAESDTNATTLQGQAVSTKTRSVKPPAWTAPLPSGHPVTSSDPPIPASSVKLDGGRMTLSLTSASAAAVLFVALALLAVSYAVGHHFGNELGKETGFQQGKAAYLAQTQDEIQQARAMPPDTHLLDGLGAGPPKAPVPAGGSAPNRHKTSIVRSTGLAAASAKNPAAQVAWVKGNNYLVIQEFDPDASADANAARDFVVGNGVDAVVVTLSNGRHNLITVQGFNFEDTTQKALAIRLQKKVQALGARYIAQGGRYKLQGYFKKRVNDDSW